MTEQQELFCREYLVDRCGTQAAMRAGYAERSAKTTACRMLALDRIKVYIARLDSEIKSQHILSAIETLERISAEACNMKNPPKDRIKSLELLAKHHGLLVERHEVGKPGDFVKLSDAEIDKEIMELAKQREAAKPMVN